MSKRILIADDERNIRFLLRTLFEQEGWAVEEAADGREALEKALASPPTLVLLDLQMPKLNGTEVIEKIQEAGVCCPVLVMTAHSIASGIRAMLLGAVGFLEKPLTPEALRQAVAAFDDSESPRRRMEPSVWPATSVRRSKPA